MTDRHSGYVVTLDAPIREDDAQRIIDAIKMVKGVLSVDPVITDAGQMIAEMKARTALFEKFIEWWKQ